MSNTKAEPIKAKAQFYAVCFAGLQEVAHKSGYNLIMHGSMHRDMDLVAVPWIDGPCSHLELIQRFCKHLGVFVWDDVSHYMPSLLPGGRQTYVINLNRGGKFNGYTDEQWYLDISITPMVGASEVKEPVCIYCQGTGEVNMMNHGTMSCQFCLEDKKGQVKESSLVGFAQYLRKRGANGYMNGWQIGMKTYSDYEVQQAYIESLKSTGDNA